MKLKQIVLILLAVTLTAGGCKKSEKATPSTPVLLAYDKITRADIVTEESNMTGNKIAVTTTIAVLKPGAIILYKTSSGNYGKLKITKNTIYNNNYLIVLDMTCYKKPDASEVTTKLNVEIKLDETLDLDTGNVGFENDIDSNTDFQFDWNNGTNNNFIDPLGSTAKFYLYSN